MVTRKRAAQPSWIWVATAVPAILLGVALIVAAGGHQREATRPIGEGELPTGPTVAAAGSDAA